MSTEEFCDLSRRTDVETVKLLQLAPASEEFAAQRQVVRDLEDRMFSHAPEEISAVADELAPLLHQSNADNDRINDLLDEVADYVAAHCQ